jgi:RNA polymerase sigma-70 factor (ECF subfamily)
MLPARLDPAPVDAAPEPGSPAAAYSAYFGPVFRNLRRLGVDAGTLEDAVQDVFVVVFRRWDDFERRSTLRTWIFGIVMRVARDHRRAQRRHVARQRLAELQAEGSQSAGTDRSLQRGEAARLLHAVLDRLNEEQRALVVLADLEELPSTEIAGIMNLNPSTCRGKLAAARRKFAEVLERLDSEPRPDERNTR